MDSVLCGGCFRERSSQPGPCPCCGFDSAADAKKYPLALAAGSILNGRYILGRVLGQGGFGITYAARDVQTGDVVAIKEFFPEILTTRTNGHSVTAYSGQREEHFQYGLQCFLSEAQTMAQFIGVENIVQVHRYFEENGTAYFVMEYVEGASLLSHIRKQGGRLTWEECKRLLFPVMDALSVVHSKGIIHRDISPDNIFITSDGRVKLLDFGSARYSLGDKSRSLDVVLKHGYAPMEQYSRRGRQGPFTDVYAMSATFYYALTGRLPQEAAERVDEDLLAMPSTYGVQIPEEVEDALVKAMSVRSVERYQTMREFREALEFTREAPPAQTEGLPEAEDRTAVQLPLEKEPETPSEDMPAAAAQEIAGEEEQAQSKKKIPLAGVIAAVAAMAAGFLLFTKPPEKDIIVETIPPTQIQEAVQTPPTEAAIQTEPTQAPMEPLPELLNLEDRDKILSTTMVRIVAIREDGTVAAAGEGRHELDPGAWKDLAAVYTQYHYAAGLKTDGTVVVNGGGNWGQLRTGTWKVSQWKDVVSLGLGLSHMVGLKTDGTVVAAGDNSKGQCDVSEWTDITAIYANSDYTLGVQSDGTVLVAGKAQFREWDTSNWRDIEKVGGSWGCIYGIRSDGTVIHQGAALLGGDTDWDDVDAWRNIAQIAVSENHIIGLKKDGTVVASRNGDYRSIAVGGWRNVIQIAVGDTHTIALKSDGTVYAAGVNDYGECNVSDWTDIVAIAADGSCTVGIRSDGTMVVTGHQAGAADVSHMKNIRIPGDGSKIQELEEPGVKLKLQKTNISMKSPFRFQLRLDCQLEQDAVTWSSEHPHIATVDDRGVVTAVSPGTTAITAKYGNQEATCIIRVFE